jgi:hypothetical protein
MGPRQSSPPGTVPPGTLTGPGGALWGTLFPDVARGTPRAPRVRPRISSRDVLTSHGKRLTVLGKYRIQVLECAHHCTAVGWSPTLPAAHSASGGRRGEQSRKDFRSCNAGHSRGRNHGGQSGTTRDRRGNGGRPLGLGSSPGEGPATTGEGRTRLGHKRTWRRIPPDETSEADIAARGLRSDRGAASGRAVHARISRMRQQRLSSGEALHATERRRDEDPGWNDARRCRTPSEEMTERVRSALDASKALSAAHERQTCGRERCVQAMARTSPR